MRHPTVPLVAGMSCAIAVLLSPPAATASEDEREGPRSVLLTREILDHIEIERPTPEHGWTSHFRLARKGVKYARPLSFGARQLTLNVSGPVMPRKSLGLRFEVKF